MVGGTAANTPLLYNIKEVEPQRFHLFCHYYVESTQVNINVCRTLSFGGCGSARRRPHPSQASPRSAASKPSLADIAKILNMYVRRDIPVRRLVLRLRHFT